ncbi:cytochrome c biogenesis CcdA family protein [Deinococcus roseus]|uniref:Cytochrome C biogenesis protein CcdA n=1 Tax=Deinococcus roseus TaxID=392414 RepID=A0ABQ2CYY4_9DEIO|nr:cytochrome c biogenesis CcdA family protein [Deinococcus roseus]GGJ34281.1 cytochrome C biogenesis protein CcdA [Deinococcus roseus]
MAEPTTSLGVALFGGLVSFLSPCVLPLLPSYLSVLGGGQAPFKRALGFVLGFSLVFIMLGAGASLIGQFLVTNKMWLNPLSGSLILFFGLVMLGVIRIPALMGDYRMGLGQASQYGPVVLGAAFALGWSPCIGPVLGGILTLATQQGSLKTGVLLLSMYALGLALPFLAAALFWQRINVRHLNKYTPYIEKVGGGILVLLGILILTGKFTELSRFFLDTMPDWMVKLL